MYNWQSYIILFFQFKIIVALMKKYNESIFISERILQHFRNMCFYKLPHRFHQQIHMDNHLRENVSHLYEFQLLYKLCLA